MKALVTGGSGLLGYRLCQVLQARGHEVLATTRCSPLPAGVALHRLELADLDAVEVLTRAAEVDVVIHCAAISNAHMCQEQPELATAVNATAPRVLAQNLTADAHFIHVSTDLVFDGTRGNYREQDSPNPLSAYGQSKLAAEHALAELAERRPVSLVRVALMYDHGPVAHPSFLGWLENGLRGDKALPLFVDEYRSAVYVPDVCNGLAEIAERKLEGTFHLAGAERLSRAAFAEAYADVFGLNKQNIARKKQAEVQLAAPRPADVSLDISKARERFGYQPRDTRTALELLKGARARANNAITT
jgi:dTDP-4-dehydrorhamnose reductase